MTKIKNDDEFYEFENDNDIKEEVGFELVHNNEKREVASILDQDYDNDDEDGGFVFEDVDEETYESKRDKNLNLTFEQPDNKAVIQSLQNKNADEIQDISNDSVTSKELNNLTDNKDNSDVSSNIDLNENIDSNVDKTDENSIKENKNSSEEYYSEKMNEYVGRKEEEAIKEDEYEENIDSFENSQKKMSLIKKKLIKKKKYAG